MLLISLIQKLSSKEDLYESILKIANKSISFSQIRVRELCYSRDLVWNKNGSL